MAVLRRSSAGKARTNAPGGSVEAGSGPGERTDGLDARRVSTARWAMISLFAVNGLTLSAWVARMPAVRDALDVSPGQLGRVLLFAALGGLVSTMLAPPLVVRLGIARSLRLSGVLFATAYVLMGLGVAMGSIAIVAAGLAVNGVAFAGGNLPLNVGSTDIERAARRPILPQFHAAFSVGTVVGSLIAAGAAGIGVALPAQLAVMAAIAVGWRWRATRFLLPEETRAVSARAADDAAPAADHAAPDPSSAGRPANALNGAPAPAVQGAPTRWGLRHAWREPRTLLIGAIAFAASGSEIGANDWLALAVVDGFLTSESFAAATLSLFVGAMTAVRLVGTPIISRLGRSRTLRVAALVGISGVVLFVTAPSPALALVGVAAWGAGSALNFPIAVSAASDDPIRAAYRVSVMSTFASAAAISSPLALGALAEAFGTRTAIGAIAVVLVAILLSAGRATAPLADPPLRAVVHTPAPTVTPEPLPTREQATALQPAAAPDASPAAAACAARAS